MCTFNLTYGKPRRGQRLKNLIVVVVLCFVAKSVFAIEASALDAKVVSAKKEMLELGRDMHIFERIAVFPDERRFSVFLTMDVGEFFSLNRIKLKIDDNWVVSREFHHHESAGLEKGAAIRIFVGNIEAGQHKMLAFFEGTGPRSRSYKRGVRRTFTKNNEPIFFEMRINDSEQRLRPEFLVKQW